MTTYNTGNPLGSADPRDLYDNAENLDEAVNDLNSDTWIDRFGVERLTIQGALNRFNDVIIAGGQIFESEEAGRAAVQDGQYYYTVSDDPDVSRELWRRIDANSSELIAEDPSAEGLRGAVEIANAAIDLASRRAHGGGEFFNDDFSGNVPLIVDQTSGRMLSALTPEGFPYNPVPGEFYNNDDQAAHYVVDQNWRVAAAFNEQGQPLVRWMREFYNNDDQAEWAMVSSGFVVAISWDEVGKLRVPGGDIIIDDLPTTPQGLSPGRLWNEHGRLAIPRRDNPALYGNVTTIFPNGHVDGYALLDQMQSEFPTYIDSSIIGNDSLGNEIREYTFLNPDYVYLRTEMRAERPTIVLLGNIHGSETGASASNFQFIWNLVYGWRNSEVMNWLRWNCNIVFVPFICPDGYDGRRRRNPNGVNLNRNFPDGWEESTASDKGDSPGSELETQAVMSIPPRYPNATYIDHHNFYNTTTKTLLWIGALTEENFKVAEAILDDANRLARREYEGLSDYLNTGNGQFRLADLINGGMDRYIQTSHGCDAFLLETRFGSWGPPREYRQQLGTRVLEFMCKRICEKQKQFSI